MKRKKLVLHICASIFLLSISVSCNSAKPDYNRKEVTKTVSGEKMKVHELEGYKLVCSYDDYLFLREDRDTSRLVVYKVDGDSLAYFKGLINKGRGPYEFYYAEFSLSGDSLFVSNSDPTGMKAIYGISLEDMDRIDNPRLWKEYVFSEFDIMTGMSFARLDKGKFVITGGKPNTRQIFSLADFNKDEQRVPLKFWPRDSTEGAMHAKQMVYMQSNMTSQNGHILYANLYAHYMFTAAVKGGELVPETIIYPRLPQYEITQDGNVRYTSDAEYGITPYSTADYIFAEIGRTAREVKSAETYKGFPNTFIDEIEVYDWKGRFVDNYQTDCPFYSFVVSDDNKYLFTMTQDMDSKEPVILRYELSL